MITPPPLKPGDKIAIVSPAGAVKTEYITKSLPILRSRGWQPLVSAHARGRSGSYSGTQEERLADLRKALLDPEVKAVLCSRGGYGAVHLLEALDELPLEDNPKWLIGYSDITALHALLGRHGLRSIHGNMTSHLASTGGTDADSLALFALLRGESMSYTFPPNALNKPGTAEGMLVGGNLAVFADLIGTRFDVLRERHDAQGRPVPLILFMEDVSEPVYKTERIMYQLRLMGVFDRIKGLVVGQFTEYSRDVEGMGMEQMIAAILRPYSFPVAFNAPIGHVKHNVPLVSGATVKLTVTPHEVTLTEMTEQQAVEDAVEDVEEAPEEPEAFPSRDED